MYHPDKHTDEELKKKADILFNKIKKSYEGMLSYFWIRVR